MFPPNLVIVIYKVKIDEKAIYPDENTVLLTAHLQ